MTSEAQKTADCSPALETLAPADEFRLLLLCARTRITPQQRELIRSLARRQLDWEFILGKAYWHALSPLLSRNLHALCADLVPRQVLRQLESHYIASAKRNLALTAELIKVLRILKSGNIIAVPYKGPALAALAYGDVALRKFCDLDLIVRPGDIINAKSLLVAHGYRWRPFKGQVTGPDEGRNFRFWHEYNFVHPDKSATVDLHWRISSRRFPVEIDLDSLWEHLRTVSLLGQDIRAFEAEISLLLLCVHGSKDLWWKRLGWSCDVAELLAARPDIDWPRALRLATDTGTRRMFLLGLALADGLLQAPLPGQVREWIDADGTVTRLERYVHHRLFDEPTVRDRILEKPRFRLRVRERIRERIPVLRHLISSAFAMVFVPRQEDRESLELRGSLSALYCVVRPARLARRLWILTTRRGGTGS
jgi:hypothetical protein